MYPRAVLYGTVLHLNYSRPETGMTETVDCRQSGERCAERLSRLEALCKQHQLFCIRHFWLLQICIGFYPEIYVSPRRTAGVSAVGDETT